MRFFILTLSCCIFFPPVPASASDTAASLPVIPMAAPADEATADGIPLESGDAAPTELPETGSENNGAAGSDLLPEDGNAAGGAEASPAAVIDLTEITLRLDSIIGMLAKLWQHVRFCAVAAFAWWFAKKSFRGVS